MSVTNIRVGVPNWRGWRAPVAEIHREPASEADRNVDRLLTLLGHSDMTIPALRELGVRSPAQTLYDLLLAGYPIERLQSTNGVEARPVRYRLDTARTIRLD